MPLEKPSAPLEPLGARIRRLRVEREITQERLSIEAHVDQSGLSKFERGHGRLGPIPLRRIAAVLGIPLEELTAGSDFRDSESLN